MSASEPITAQRLAGAANAIAGVTRVTPVISTRGISELLGSPVVYKAENLQRTGSFKLRGSLAKLAALGEQSAAGVTAGSAGNHAQAVAYAARELGVGCEVFMPVGAAIGKVDACIGLGAEVHQVGRSVIEAVAAARDRAERNGMTLVHPFDDPDVIAGQATLGAEILQQVTDLEQIVVPLGGGGLASGVALVVKQALPHVRIIGVQARACAPYLQLRRGEPISVAGAAASIADGIAVKQPGELTGQLIAEFVDDVVAVSEDAIAEAMVHLLEREKLVVEGAGAVALAAVREGLVEPTKNGGTTALILSGGNVDIGLVAAVARRHESQVGRRCVLFTLVPDRPGKLADLLTIIGSNGANLVEVQHVRDGVDLHVRETAVQLVLETRGAQHAALVQGAVEAAGYTVRRVSLASPGTNRPGIAAPPRQALNEKFLRRARHVVMVVVRR